MLFKKFQSLCSNLNFILLSSDLFVFTVKIRMNGQKYFSFFFSPKLILNFTVGRGVGLLQQTTLHDASLQCSAHLTVITVHYTTLTY